MEFRRAVQEDLDAVLENRLAFVTSLGALSDVDGFRRKTRAYLERHLADGSLICMLCIQDGEIRSSCMLCVYETLPTPSAPNGKCGLLLNVYTLEAYRRQGLARRLLRMLIEEARSVGISKIELSATEDGYPLYQSLGFYLMEKEMRLKL